MVRRHHLRVDAAVFCCDFITFFTIFASSTKNARRILDRACSETVGSVDRTYIPGLDASATSRAAVRSSDRLLALGYRCVLSWSESRNLAKEGNRINKE
jgi:hypothetical protein